MQPIERFKKTNTEGNIWMYILSLARDGEVKNDDVQHLVFEKFGFLPNNLLVRRVIFRLKQQGFASNERNQGKPAYRATKAGLGQLDQMRAFCQQLLDKI